jgi:hypothetical protein
VLRHREKNACAGTAVRLLPRGEQLRASSRQLRRSIGAATRARLAATLHPS